MKFFNYVFASTTDEIMMYNFIVIFVININRLPMYTYTGCLFLASVRFMMINRQ